MQEASDLYAFPPFMLVRRCPEKRQVGPCPTRSRTEGTKTLASIHDPSQTHHTIGCHARDVREPAGSGVRGAWSARREHFPDAQHATQEWRHPAMGLRMLECSPYHIIHAPLTSLQQRANVNARLCLKDPGHLSLGQEEGDHIMQDMKVPGDMRVFQIQLIIHSRPCMGIIPPRGVAGRQDTVPSAAIGPQ
jgi:hypothetical protein